MTLMPDTEFRLKMATIHAWSQTPPDDPKDMFQYKYEARREWEGLVDECLEKYNDRNTYSDEQRWVLLGRLAALYVSLGQCMSECKETQEGKIRFDTARCALEAARRNQFYDFSLGATGSGTTDEAGDVNFDHPNYRFADIHVSVLNFIARQWSTWGEDLKARRVLEMSQKIYDDWSKNSVVKQLEAATAESNRQKHRTDLDDVVANFEHHARRSNEAREHERQAQQSELEARIAARRAKKAARGGGASGADATSPTSAQSPTTDGDINEATTSTAPASGSAAFLAESEEAEKKRIEKKVADQAELSDRVTRLVNTEVSDDEIQVSIAMDKMNSVTNYLMAQVLAALDKSHEAATYYLITLNRQLELRSRDFDRLEWASNCAYLANYYLLEYDLAAAFHCLQASELLLPKGPMPASSEQGEQEEPQDEEAAAAAAAAAAESEKFEKITNNMKLLWARYHQKWLKLCRDAELELRKQAEQKKQGGQEGGKKDDETAIEFPAPDRVRRKIPNEVPAVHFKRLPLAPPEPHLPFLQTYPQLRQVFQKAFDNYNEVIDFYDIDAWTEVRIEMLQELSSLHECMAFYTVSLPQKRALMLQRVKYLEQPLEILTNVIFTNVLRQYRFEIGTVYQEVAEIAITERRTDEGDAPSLAQTVEWLESSRSSFQAFVDTFKREWEWQQKQKREEDRQREMILDEDYCPAFLMGYLHLAQLATKQPDPRTDVATIDAGIDTAIGHYKYVIEYARKCKMDKLNADVRQQVEMCEQMVALLPTAKSTHDKTSALTVIENLEKEKAPKATPKAGTGGVLAAGTKHTATIRPTVVARPGSAASTGKPLVRAVGYSGASAAAKPATKAATTPASVAPAAGAKASKPIVRVVAKPAPK